MPVADAPRVSLQAFSSARPREQRTGLLGWVVLEVDGLIVVERIALRRTREGRLALSFPAPKDRRGRRYPLVRPLNDAARRAIESHVFVALDEQGVEL